MLTDWVLGVLLRPGDTFERARNELRFGYWWILLSAMTIQIVTSLYSPRNVAQPAPTDAVVFFEINWYLMVILVHALCFFGAARLFQWTISWSDTMKYVGLLQAVQLIENISLFYPGLKGLHALTWWIDIGFYFWYVTVMTVGVRRITGLSTFRAVLLSTLSVLPWWGTISALSWFTMPH